MKLISKERYGAKVTKRYDKAKTPSQRLLTSPQLSEENKEKLREQYKGLDPLHLLKELENLQNQFWSYAWKDSHASHQISKIIEAQKLVPTELTDVACQEKVKKSKQKENQGETTSPIRRYRKTPKPRKPLAPRTWKTRKDEFETVWNRLVTNLQVNPRCNPRDMLTELIKEDPQRFNIKQLRTLQRRVANWRLAQSEYERSKRSEGKFTPFLTLAEEAAK